MPEHRGPTHYCFGAISRLLSCMTWCLVAVQELLNTIWYCFALYTANKVGMWPNYTTGKLSEIPTDLNVTTMKWEIANCILAAVYIPMELWGSFYH